MKAKTKIIFGSAMTVAMCASLIAGSTFALFTSEAKTNIAITSGKVKVSAQVTDLFLSSNAESDDFNWVKATDTVEGAEGSIKGTFANDGTASYTVEDGVGTLNLNNITPGDAVKFTLSITNESTVAMKYQVRVLTGDEAYLGEEDPYPGVKLSSALQFGFGVDALKTGLVYAATEWSSVITEATTEEKTVTIAFPRTSTEDQNQYQNRSCEISLTVLAVQGNAKETSYCDENSHKYVDDVCIYCGQDNPFKGEGLHEEDTGDTYTIKGAPTGVKELVIPHEINGKEVKLAAGTFQENTDLETVVFGEGFTELTDPDPSGTLWGAFYGCTNLTSVTLPSTLTKINRYSFYGCKNLKKITVPASVTLIDDNAFYNSGLESVSLSEGLLTIDSDAFRHTPLKSLVIPDTVTEIGLRAFANCTQLESVKIGNSLVEIKGDNKGNNPGGVFYDCENLLSVELGSSVTTIGPNAFEYCYRLVEVINQSTYDAKTKAEGAAEGDVGYYAAEIREGADATKSRITADGDYRFYTTAEGKKYLVGYAGEGERVTLTLPDDGEAYEIYNYAFYQNRNIADVTFGNSVTAIGEYAFAETQLGTNHYYDFTIAGGIKTIGAHAFENAFASSEYFVTAYIGDDVTTIGDEAFSGCTWLYEVCIGTPHSRYDSTKTNSKLESIGQGAFKGCTVNSAGGFRFRNIAAKWKELTDGKNVFENVKSITVRCSDGNLKYSNGALAE